MKLYFKCKNCKFETSFNCLVKTRVDLVLKKRDNFTLDCNSCYVKKTYHVNDIYTKTSKLVQIIPFILFVIGCISLGYIVFGNHNIMNNLSLKLIALIGIPITVYTILTKEDIKRVNTFNRHKF